MVESAEVGICNPRTHFRPISHARAPAMNHRELDHAHQGPPGEGELKRLLTELAALVAREPQRLPPPPGVQALVIRCAQCARDGHVPAERFIAQLKDTVRRATPQVSTLDRAEQMRTIVLWAIQGYYRGGE